MGVAICASIDAVAGSIVLVEAWSVGATRFVATSRRDEKDYRGKK
jgi:hypothetical protein